VSELAHVGFRRAWDSYAYRGMVLPVKLYLDGTLTPVEIIWVAPTMIPLFIPATSDWGLVHSPRRSDGDQAKDGPLARCPTH